MDAGRRANLLRTCLLFEHLSAGDLDQLAGLTSLRQYRRGQVVFYEGDPGDSLLLVAEGWLKVLTSSRDGEPLLLGTVGPPETIGVIALADGGPRSATVEALTDAAVLRVARADVTALVASRPEIGLSLAQMLATALRRLTGAAADLAFLDLPRRLAKLLVERDRASGGGLIDPPWTQTDMAHAIGASRQSVNVALRDFTRRGWVATEGATVRVRDPEALARFAEA